MPQIPTFRSQARPTAEVGSVKSNLQVPLTQTLAGALQPVTDYVVEKQIAENDLQNKTKWQCNQLTKLLVKILN